MDYRRACSFIWRILHTPIRSAFPKAGGSYVYLKPGLGHFGFLFGWMSSFPSGLWNGRFGRGFRAILAFLFPVVAALCHGHIKH